MQRTPIRENPLSLLSQALGRRRSQLDKNSPPNPNPNKVRFARGMQGWAEMLRRSVAKLEVRMERQKKTRSAEVPFALICGGNGDVDGVQEKLPAPESDLQLPAGRTSVFIQRHPAEQTAEGDESAQILKITDIRLGTPSGQGCDPLDLLCGLLLVRIVRLCLAAAAETASHSCSNTQLITPQEFDERTGLLLDGIRSVEVPSAHDCWGIDDGGCEKHLLSGANPTKSDLQQLAGTTAEQTAEDDESTQIIGNDDICPGTPSGQDARTNFLLDEFHQSPEDSMETDVMNSPYGSTKRQVGEDVDKENSPLAPWDLEEDESSSYGSEDWETGEPSFLEKDDFDRFDTLQLLEYRQQEEGESHHEGTQETEGSKHKRPSEKSLLPMAASFIKRNYVYYQGLQILKGVVVDWACVNFSSMQCGLNYFLDHLAFACSNAGMHFSPVPFKKFHLKSTGTDNVWKTFCYVRESMLEMLSGPMFEMEEEPVGLLLVILPENRDFDEQIQEACKKLRVVYHCCLPCDVRTTTKQYVKRTAREIKSKVVERDMFIPFVSEGPTIILGAAICDTFASVVTSVDWQDFTSYESVVEPNNEAFIQQLGGMIRNLLKGWKMKKDCRIIFFRHGINGDQIDYICHRELEAIKQVFTHLGGGFKPPVTFVVVGGVGLEEHTIDFFCNHGFVEGMGTARYRVIHDENNLSLLDLESIIIKLCLLRCRRTYRNISMVPPAYAAWLAAWEAQIDSNGGKTVTASSNVDGKLKLTAMMA